MLQRGSYNTLYRNKEGEVNIVNIVMIKNIFFLSNLYKSLK